MNQSQWIGVECKRTIGGQSQHYWGAVGWPVCQSRVITVTGYVDAGGRGGGNPEKCTSRFFEAPIGSTLMEAERHPGGG